MVERLPLEEIKRRLSALELSHPSKADFLRLESQMIDAASDLIKAPFTPAVIEDLKKYLVTPSLKRTKARIKPLGQLMVALGVNAFFTKTYDFEKVVACRARLEVRVAIEALVLARQTNDQIHALIEQRFGLGLSRLDVKYYLSFFFDTEEMDQESWHFHLLSSDPEEAKVKVSVIRDPENLPAVKHLTGFDVKLDYLDLLRDVYTSSYFLWKDAVKQAGDSPVARANILSAMMMRAGDRFKKHEKPDEKAQLNQMIINIQNVNSTTAPRANVLLHLPPPPEERKTMLVPLPGGKVEKDPA